MRPSPLIPLLLPCGGAAALRLPSATLSRRRSFTTTKAAAIVPGQDPGELFDLYEAPHPSPRLFSGEPTATGFSKARQLVHRDGDWHRAINVWMYTSRGELLLQRRAEGKDTFPGRWDVSVAGHITSGDSVLETALKEVEEELGISISSSTNTTTTTTTHSNNSNALLEKIGVVATMARGSSPLGGAFECNEYKDLYLYKLNFADGGGDVDIKTALDFQPNEEVSDVKLVPWLEVKQDMLAQLNDKDGELDGPMVPRPRHYIDLLFDALAGRVGSGEVY